MHISAHGNNAGGITLDENGKSPVVINSEDIKNRLNRREVRKEPLKGRFVTISACGEINSRFAKCLHKYAGATAVIAPLASVQFGESALFSMMFYFTLLSPHGRERGHSSAERLGQYIDSFHKTKRAYLNVGGTGAHRLEYWWQGKHQTTS